MHASCKNRSTRKPRYTPGGKPVCRLVGLICLVYDNLHINGCARVLLFLHVPGCQQVLGSVVVGGTYIQSGSALLWWSRSINWLEFHAIVVVVRPRSNGSTGFHRAWRFILGEVQNGDSIMIEGRVKNDAIHILFGRIIFSDVVFWYLARWRRDFLRNCFNTSEEQDPGMGLYPRSWRSVKKMDALLSCLIYSPSYSNHFRTNSVGIQMSMLFEHKSN